MGVLDTVGHGHLVGDSVALHNAADRPLQTHGY
jgi:hypothetical protein